MSNEVITFSAGLTDVIEAREENLREECGSRYNFSTAFPLTHQETRHKSEYRNMSHSHAFM